MLSYKVQRVHWSVCAPNKNDSSNHLNCWGKCAATILSDQMHHFPGLHDKSYSNHVFCHSWFIKNICACWLSILNKFHFNLAFALSCIGNKPLQAFTVVVARYQEFKSPNKRFFFSYIFFPVFYFIFPTIFMSSVYVTEKRWWAENTGKHVSWSLVMSIEIFS